MLDKLKLFQSKENLKTWDNLQCWIIVKDTLKEIKDILECYWEYNEDIENMSKEILFRSLMLDTIFNHIYEYEWTLYNEKKEIVEKSDLYWHTPNIWIFHKWSPIFLNRNYFEALWATDLETLKEDIKNWLSLRKYYAPESQLIVEHALSKLRLWDWYKNLRLETKNWKIISWNSFWIIDWLEIRIWNDVTNWTFNQWDIAPSSINENLSLDTKQLITKYLNEVWKIVNFDAIKSQKAKLVIFCMLSSIIDTVWNSSQYLMNTSIEKEEGTKENRMSCNNNYLSVLWLSYEEIIQKIQNNTLYRDHYKWDIEDLVKWLWKTLKKEWFYFSDFWLIDSQWKTKNYSWYRRLLKDEDFGLHRTFGIGNNSLSKEDAELLKYLWGL